MRLREFNEKEKLEKANEKLKKYKTDAGADATAADAAGNFTRGNKRFKGINRATNRQFANDAKLSQLKEFAPSGDDGDGFSEETLKRLAAQWWNGDEDPRVEKLLMSAGWEIGQDEGYDNGGVFVIRAGDDQGDSYISWPAEDLQMNEVAPPGAKAERMVKHIKAGYARDGKLTPKEKGIAFATAWKAHNAGRVEEATGDERFDSMMGQIQREPRIPDSQMPPTDVRDLHAWAVKNHKPYHKIFAEWAMREGYKSVAPALQKAGNLDSDALDYWTPDVWKLWYGPDSEMPRHWSKERVPEELRDYLETVFDAYENIWQDWPTEYRQISEQGVTEMDKSQPSAGRDTGPRPGPERVATPIKPEQMVTHALDTLARSMARKDDKKKDDKKKDVSEDQLDELSKDTLKDYMRAQPARIKGPTGLATTNPTKAARIVDPEKGDIRRALDKYKDPEYGQQQRRLPEDSLAAMCRLAGVTTPAPVVSNGPRQYRHMPTAVQPR
jgi:hypothetical protein